MCFCDLQTVDKAMPSTPAPLEKYRSCFSYAQCEKALPDHPITLVLVPRYQMPISCSTGESHPGRGGTLGAQKGDN